jgi:poly(3-hydroxybutyrate) depolymerase
MRRPTLACAFLALSVSTRAAAADAPPLGAYDVKLDETTVSGISSGAYMAVQLAVARSSIVAGVGALAGGPYACAQGDLATALGPCMIGPPPDAAALRKLAERFAAEGHLDDPRALARQKVWILHGYNDGVVKEPVSAALAAFYDAAAGGGGRSRHVHYRDDLPAAHAQVTDAFGQACEKTGGEFINRCAGYDAAGFVLQFAYGKLRERAPDGKLSGALLPFRQSELYADPASIGLDDTGYVYVPAPCAAGERCRVHVAFHGCLQNARTIGTDYVLHAGYNGWADANRIVVLYPQTVASGRVKNPLSRAPYNPNGCWDWWGYTGAQYHTRDGAQIRAVMAMLKRLSEPRPAR